jgi:CheY-like chemotaxis protein
MSKLVTMLRDAGHGVFAAYDGRSACELAEYIPDLDLVITNTRLCNLDAPELVRRVRTSKPWLAILHVGDPLPCEGPLADVPTIREPFTSAELLRAVSGALLTHTNGSAAGSREAPHHA